jgi:hypothetical protein
LQVGSANSFQIQKSGVTGYINQSDSGPIIVRMGSGFAEKLRLTNVGAGAALGVGITPEGAYSGYSSIEFGQQGAIFANVAGDDFGFKVNTYLDSGGNWKRKETGVSSALDMDGDQIKFFTAASGSADANITFAQKLRIDNDGIKFGSDTAAANALDDYEEGTWTPRIGGWSNSTVKTAGSQNQGHYTKVGKLVTVTANIIWNGTETLSGGIIVRGLPYAAKSVAGYRAGGSIAGFSGLAASGSYTYFTLGIDASNTYFYIINANASSYGHSPTVSNSGAIYGITFSYHV